VAYVRASTGKQELSPAAQSAAIEAYAAAHGLRLVVVCVDRLKGATPLDQRPAFAEAIAALREHRAGILLILRRDRLARDSLVAMLADKAVDAAGARVVCADGAGNGTTDSDAFMRSVLDAASAYERALIRSRTRAGLAIKRTRGEKTGGELPYGYAAETRLVDGKPRLFLVPLPAEQAVIERVRALRAEGVSFDRAARQLVADGFTPRSGGRWHATQLQRMVAA
jgi:DNA invertase Pin-like site-specific DNA recombinase